MQKVLGNCYHKYPNFFVKISRIHWISQMKTRAYVFDRSFYLSFVTFHGCQSREWENLLPTLMYFKIHILFTILSGYTRY